MVERLTEKRDSQNTIPLKNAVCGLDMPYWALCHQDSVTDMYLAGDAADRLAAYEDLGSVEEFAALKERTRAERDGQLYTVHDVAVILASAIGDDCACNINSNDEWLPQLCELQEACPYPVGVACWEQYLKHRAGAEKALGKEAQS